MLKRKLAFWAIVILAVALLTDPVLSIQDMLGNDSFGTEMTYPNSWIETDLYLFHSYALWIHGGIRYAVRGWMLIAVIIGLGAFTSWEIVEEGASVIWAAIFVIATPAIFRFAEVYTDTFMVSGICEGSRAACPNEAMDFIEGDRFTILAYFLLGVAIVVGGIYARRAYNRFVVPPPAPASVVATEPAPSAALEDGAPPPDAHFSPAS